MIRQSCGTCSSESRIDLGVEREAFIVKNYVKIQLTVNGGKGVFKTLLHVMLRLSLREVTW